MADENPIDEFFKSIVPMLNVYRQYRIRCLAVERGGRYHNLATEILFETTSETPPLPDDLRSLPNPLRIFQAFNRYDGSLKEKLDEISTGRLIINGETVYLSKLNQDTESSLSTGFLHFSRRPGQPNSRAVLKCSFELLESRSGESLRTFIRDYEGLNIQLQSQESPFTDLTDVARSLFIHRHPLTGDNSSTVRVIAPWHACLGEGVWKNGRLLEVSVHSDFRFDDSAVNLGFVLTEQDGQVRRGQCAVSLANEESHSFRYLASVPVEGIARVTAMLRIGGQAIESRDYCRPSYGMTLLERFPDQLSDLRQYLATEVPETNKKEKQIKDIRVNRFELGVMFFLQLCDWQCYPYGILGDSNSIDGLALNLGNRDVLVYECTYAEPDHKQKISKLFGRTSGIRIDLPQYQFWPVLFTVFPRVKVTPAELSDALKAGVLIVCQDDISTWFESLEKGESVDIIGWGKARMSGNW